MTQSSSDNHYQHDAEPSGPDGLFFRTTKSKVDVSGPTRRRLLTAAGGALAFSAGAPPAFAGGSATGGLTGGQKDPEREDGPFFTSNGEQPLAADYDKLRATWRSIIIGENVDPKDSRFAAAIATLDTDAETARALVDRRPDRDRVFTDLAFATVPANITTTYTRLGRMAIAWATNGSKLFGNADVLADVVAALRTTYDKVYNERQAEFGNWWEWEIGSTRGLTDILTVVYDHVSSEDLLLYLGAIDHFVPDPFYMFPPERRIVSTGANRVDLCRAIAARGVLGKTDEKIGRARDGLSDIFAYVTSGDGFYRDGSFVQHGTVAYTGTYGVELIDGMSKLIALLADSPWVVDDPDREVLFKGIEITFAPVIYDNQMLDFIRGRAVSRAYRQDHADGHSAVEHVLRLADGVEAENAARAKAWRALCKGWLTRDKFDDPFTGARVPRVAAYAKLLADDTISATPEPVGFTIFPSMDRAVHRRNGWAYGISLSSKRISYYEAGNGENNKGFHAGEGMTWLYTQAGNGQFADGFWPTVDYYKMPGTTIDTKPLPDAAGGTFGAARPKIVTWAGGTKLGDFGAMGMDLEGILAPLRGRKSWFCLDDFVVALGAGITDTNGVAVETIVENRNLHADGTPSLIVDGRRQSSDLGWSIDKQVSWAHLDGVAGYVFPGHVQVNAKREARTGSWRDIHPSGPTDPITRRWFTMWLDHGIDPVDASYAYVVLPRASARRTAELAHGDEVHILANTPTLQAVSVPRLGVIGANFFAAGAVAGIAVNAPCSVLLRERRGKLTVAISDPTQLQDALDVTINRAGYRAVDVDDTIDVLSVRQKIRLAVHTLASAGTSHNATFAR